MLMADIPFRVLLDLTDLKIPNYKFIWISISPKEITTIEDLRRYIMQKIGFTVISVKLYLGEGLLLENENISVLREDDFVRVIKDESFAEDNFNQNMKHIKVKRKSHSESANTLDISSTKNKKCQTNIEFYDIVSKDVSKGKSNNLENIENKFKKRSKQDVLPENSINCSFDKEQNLISNSESFSSNMNITNGSTVFDPVQKKIAEEFFESGCSDCNISSVFLNRGDSLYSFKCNLHSISQISNTSQINNINSSSGKSTSTTKPNASNVSQEPSFYATTESNVEVSNISTKKKRKRHRKRKALSSCDASVEFVPVNHEMDLCQNIIDASNVKRKHIVFSPSSNQKQVDKPQVLSLDSSSNDCDFAYNTINNNNLVNQKIKSNAASPSKSNSCGGSNWDVSPVIENISQKCSKSNHNIKNQSLSNEEKFETKKTEQIKHEERNYEMLPALSHQPKIGMHIAYKVLELDEFYSPRVSEYREGVVKRIDPASDEIEIELLKHMIKPGRVGKFENLTGDDDLPPPEIIKQDVLSWTGLVEPKLISSSS